MGKIIQFRLNYNPSRQQALQWLSQHYVGFPNFGRTSVYSVEIFHGWRFVSGLDNIVYFANGIDPGITVEELVRFQSKHS